jgi:hypothetical protein
MSNIPQEYTVKFRMKSFGTSIERVTAASADEAIALAIAPYVEKYGQQPEVIFSAMTEEEQAQADRDSTKTDFEPDSEDAENE